MLVFGGTSAAGRRGDLWQLRQGTWMELPTSGGPSARFTSGAVMDPDRDRWIVMSGDDGDARDDVWALALDGDTWGELPKGPSARFDVASAVFERRAWFFAGFADGYVPLDDLWELDLDTDVWRELPATARPAKRTNCAMAHHGGFLYVLGGHDDEVLTKDFWRYDLSGQRWEPVGGPTELDAWAHFAYARGPGAELWLFGGDNDDFMDVATTWRVMLGSPLAIDEILPAAGDSPVPVRRHATLVYAGGPLLFGGWAGRTDLLGDTRLGTVLPALKCEASDE